ncbi:MAG TPA: CBS domain-containing protein [Gemmatimonadaceae bacterium]|nr:CBS domain-containing protein [Gemmatimonadaceae bacterium]
MLKASEIMTKQVVTVEPDTTLRDAAELFTAKHIGGAPVCRGNKVVGVISLGDIIDFTTTAPEESVGDAGREPDDQRLEEEEEDAAAASYYMDVTEDSADVDDRMQEPAFAERRLYDEHVVEEAMSTNPIGVSPNDTVVDVAKVMQRRGIHRVLVLDGEKLEGIVSTMDVARALADGSIR